MDGMGMILATSRPPVDVGDEGWVEVRDSYGGLLCRYHPQSGVMEFKGRSKRMAYLKINHQERPLNME